MTRKTRLYLGCTLICAVSWAANCAGLSPAEQVTYGMATARAACEIYADDLTIPRDHEVDAVCVALSGDE